jgi:hypothetical protein
MPNKHNAGGCGAERALNGLSEVRCQEPSWTENLELRFDLAINSENFS